MNGFNMQQFVLGFAIARPLAEQRDRMLVGLTASMFPASNPYGAILLKPQVDALAAREAEVVSLRAQLQAAAGATAFFTSTWLNKKSIAVGEAADESPPYTGPGDIGVESDTPAAASARWDAAKRTVVIERKPGLTKAADVNITLYFADRKIVVPRTLTV